MKIRNILLATLLSVLPIAGLFCAGGTSESGNSRSVIVGSIVDVNGAIRGARVQLVAEAFVPGNDTAGKVFTTHTDDRGAYRLEQVSKGYYYLNSRVLGKRLLRGPIEITKPEEDLATDSLCATAQVTMRLPDAGNINVIFIKGTAESWTVASKTIVLDSMPTGEVTVVGFASNGNVPQTLSSANSLQLTVSMAPADTVKAAFNNAPPVIVTEPSSLSRSVLITDSAYKAKIIATDPENGALLFRVISAPAGMSLDSLTGTIIWQPAGSVVGGIFRVGVLVTDKQGSTRSIWWTITVVESYHPGPDTIAPVITLLGSADTSILIGVGGYVDPGAFITGDCDTPNSCRLLKTGSVDIGKIGTYVIFYNASDMAGNKAETKTRTVHLIPTTEEGDPMKPEIVLLGKTRDTVRIGDTWVEPGYTVWDNRDTNGLGAQVVVTGGPVVTTVETFFRLQYVVKDSAGNSSDVKQRIIVVFAQGVTDTIPPTLNLEGKPRDTISVGTKYNDPGATATDMVPGNPTAVNLTAAITRVIKNSSGATVQFDQFYKSVGLYYLIYSVQDAAGNQALDVFRTIFVRDTAISPPDTGAPIILYGR